MRRPAWHLRGSAALLKVVVPLQPLQLLHDPLLDLLVGPVNDYLGKGLLILQLMAHLRVATRVLTDTDARAGLTLYSTTADWRAVLAVHLWLRLLVHSGRTIGLRVIIIVDVDVVVVYYLNDFARGAFPKRP